MNPLSLFGDKKAMEELGLVIGYLKLLPEINARLKVLEEKLTLIERESSHVG